MMHTLVEETIAIEPERGLFDAVDRTLVGFASLHLLTVVTYLLRNFPDHGDAPANFALPFLCFRRQSRGSERPLTRHHASSLKSAQDPVDSTFCQGRAFYGPSLPLSTPAPKHCLEGPPLPRTQVTLPKHLTRDSQA